MRPVPVLWVSGSPGVGKSTAAWALYARMGSAGHQVAYIDIDQLGLFAPAPTSDPERHAVKAALLAEVLATFIRHGARQLIVSGIVDPDRGIDPAIRQAPAFDVTLVRLTCSADELRRRYLGRGSPADRLAELMSVADSFDRNDIGVALDTSAMSPTQVADALLAYTDYRAPCAEPSFDAPAAVEVSGSGAPVLLVSGPTAVGKSTVGWQVLSTLWERGVATAYVDVDQLGFHAPESSVRLKAENLATAWRGYRDAGAEVLIVVARGAATPYQQALTGDRVHTVQLDASPAVLAERVTRRAGGAGVRLAGDSLIEVPPWQQRHIAARAADESRDLRTRVTASSQILDTSGMDSATVAASLLRLLEPALPTS